MKHIEGNYYEHEGELYKKLKGTPRGYHIITEEGKQGWLRLKCTDCTRTENTPEPNGIDMCCTGSTPKVDCTDSTPVQNVQYVQIVQDTLDEANCTDSTGVQGVQCTDSTECNNTTSSDKSDNTTEPEENIDLIAAAKGVYF